MWSLLRWYLLGKLLGGNRPAGTPAKRGGCGCFTLLLVLAIVALALYLLGFLGNASQTDSTW